MKLKRAYKTVREKEEITEFLKGKKLKIIGNHNSHSYGNIGTIITVVSIRIVSTSASVITYQKEGQTTKKVGNNIRFEDLQLVEAFGEKFLKEEIAKIKKQRSDLLKKEKQIKEELNFFKDNPDANRSIPVSYYVNAIKLIKNKDLPEIKKAEEFFKLLEDNE